MKIQKEMLNMVVIRESRIGVSRYRVRSDAYLFPWLEFFIRNLRLYSKEE